MGTHYDQLTLVERYQIQALIEQRYSERKIGDRLGRSNKTISRELHRCPKGRYDAEEAHRVALSLRHHSAKFNKRSDALIRLVEPFLKLGFTPEQISGRMRLEGTSLSVSTQSIYRLIADKGWRHLLPRQGKRYRKRSPKDAGVALIPGRVDIDQRPKIVEAKSQLGHWEGDTVHADDGYLVTLVERVSKTLLFARVKRKTKRAVTSAIIRTLAPYRAICHTITFDNGGEFAGHQSIAKMLGCRIYFAKPYHSWQRGLNENSNGLLRRYFPKKSKIGSIPTSKLEDVQLLLNFRPRKTLNYYSPIEILAGKRVSLMEEM